MKNGIPLLYPDYHSRAWLDVKEHDIDQILKTHAVYTPLKWSL